MLGSSHTHELAGGRAGVGALVALMGLFLFPGAVKGQAWVWKTETVDQSGKFTSLVTDDLGNLHIAYLKDGEGIKYGFRPAGSSKWFTMVLDPSGGFVRLTVDQQGNPHICSTHGVMKYGHWDGQKWNMQQIAPGSGDIFFSCSVAVGADGTPHTTWYQYGGRDGKAYLHLRYAVLKDGVWLARTIDFDGETGKWNSMVVDARGNPHISYSAFFRGQLKYAHWNGKNWVVTAVDSRSQTSQQNRGMGNSLILDAQGNVHISYFDENGLKYARQQGNTWSIQSVDLASAVVDWAGYRSSLVLDPRGFPHICYEDAGAVKHAYWDGEQWRIRVIVGSEGGQRRFSSMSMDRQGTLYISYIDSIDNSLKVAIGQSPTEWKAAVSEKKEKN